MMRPVAAHVLELDVALRQFEVATAHLSRGMGKRARRRVAEAYEGVRLAAGRLVIAECAAAFSASRDDAREAVVMVIQTARSTGAVDWHEIVDIVNDAAEGRP